MDGSITQTTPAARGLRILAADEDSAALERTAGLLEGLGHDVTGCVASPAAACEVIAREEPDAAVVVVHEDAEHALELIDELSEALAGPVVAMRNGPDPGFAAAAARRGLDALAEEPTAEGLQAALEVALRRHADRARLAEQVGQLEHALERRAVIERAKGRLMERHGLGEREAFERLRAQARSRSMTVVALAHEITQDP